MENERRKNYVKLGLTCLVVLVLLALIVSSGFCRHQCHPCNESGCGHHVLHLVPFNPGYWADFFCFDGVNAEGLYPCRSTANCAGVTFIPIGVNRNQPESCRVDSDCPAGLVCYEGSCIDERWPGLMDELEELKRLSSAHEPQLDACIDTATRALELHRAIPVSENERRDAKALVGAVLMHRGACYAEKWLATKTSGNEDPGLSEDAIRDLERSLNMVPEDYAEPRFGALISLYTLYHRLGALRERRRLVPLLQQPQIVEYCNGYVEALRATYQAVPEPPNWSLFCEDYERYLDENIRDYQY